MTRISIPPYGVNEFSIYQDLYNFSKYLNRFMVSRQIDDVIKVSMKKLLGTILIIYH
jgi:hypothetical protein